MKTFTIYHVPGHKVGATGNWPRRSKTNFKKYGVEPHIIEQLELSDTLENWQIVGDLEFEYADDLGYDRGLHYIQIRKAGRLTLAQKAAGGRNGTFEDRSRRGKIGGKIGGRIEGRIGGWIAGLIGGNFCRLLCLTRLTTHH